MKLIKPQFWLNKNLFAYLLYPLSIITHLINILKNYSSKKKLDIKTICIGNLYVGGTGKTSLAIEANNILKKKYKTVFIKKNYEDQKDELNLLKSRGKIIFTKNRIDSLLIAQKKKFNIAILDDGLQQKNINYDLKIVCFNSSEGFGNKFMFPAGPLRESLNELKKYDVAFINGEKKNYKLVKKIKSINKNIKIFQSQYRPLNLKKFNRNKKYLMFCGIGNPQEFENTLLKYKFKIKYKKIFPDHYKISLSEINELKKIAKNKGLSIITTEKDYIRMKKNELKNIKFLKINLKINKLNEFKKLLMSNL